MKIFQIELTFCASLLLTMAAGCDNPLIKGLAQLNQEQVPVVKGSCSAVDSESTCRDFIGSDWAWEKIQAQCTSTQMRISQYSCPKTDLGGCQMSATSTGRYIIWYYDRGDKAYDNNTAREARNKCSKISDAAWVLHTPSLFNL